jgi:helicase domain protein
MNLFEHNKKAYDSAVQMLSERGKAAIIHPTGTGKSFIGFKLCEDNPDKKVLWLSPSEYIFKTQVENLKATGAEFPENIVYLTYAKLMHMSDEELKKISPNITIWDEFHRAGAAQWGQGIQKILDIFPDIPVLGLSATAIRYLDNQRDMAEELFDGNIASEMTLGEAIVRGILNPPRYVLCAYSYQKNLEKFQRRVKNAKNKAVRDAAQVYLDALRRSLEKADGLNIIFDKYITERSGKYIVFCANKEHMDEMISHVPKWFGKVDTSPKIYAVYSDDPAASKSFAAFMEDNSEHLKLLFCIDALNEGIHVEGVSGVILLRPTVSPIIYKQQIGRALSASKKNDAVIFDIVMNIENLYSIDSIKEEMRVAMTYYHCFGGMEIVNDKFTIIDELHDCRELFEKLNDTLTSSWDLMFSYAQKYYKQYQNLDIQRRYKTPDGYSLGSWIFTQRRIYNGEINGILSEDRIEKLNSIGMIWDNYAEQSWKKNYAAAKAYYEEHSDLNVPANYVTQNIHLGSWLNNLRTYRKSGLRSSYLTKKHIAELDEIGMIWNVPDYVFERNYSSALEYFRENGNLNVPYNYVDKNGIRLGMWIKNLRSAKKNDKLNLTDEQIARLSEIGMFWETIYDVKWETGFENARKYYLKNHSLDVPAAYVTEDGFKLGNWISDQREKFRSNKMKQDRIDRLNGIQMIWQKEDPWEVRFALAEEYYKEHKDLNMLAVYNVNGICLTKWVNEQKQAYRGNRKISLTDEQIRRLESIGIDWRNSDEIAWEKRYNAVKNYFNEHGNIDIPKDIVLSDGKKIGNWLFIQRRKYRENSLTSEQIRLLNEVGMVWELADSWEIGFAHAKQYYSENKNLKISANYICPDGYNLGSWIVNQRAIFNKPTKYSRISEEQKTRLESIGMVWNAFDIKFNSALEDCKAFYSEYGHLCIPSDMIGEKSGVRLKNWVADQRRKLRQGKIPAEKAAELSKAHITVDVIKIKIPIENSVKVKKVV